MCKCVYVGGHLISDNEGFCFYVSGFNPFTLYPSENLAIKR